MATYTWDFIASGNTSFTFSNVYDGLHVTSDGVINSNRTVAVQGDGNDTLWNDGLIQSSTGTAVSMSGGSNYVSIGADAAMYGLGSTGLSMSGGDSTTVNDGWIYGARYGTLQYGDGNTVDNTGTISAGNSGFYGVYARGADFALDNSGTVSGPWIGVAVHGDNAQIVNTGTISGSSGVYLNSDGGTLVNEGTLTGSAFHAGGNHLRHGAYATGEDSTIVNEAGGSIIGSGAVSAGAALGGYADGAVIENHGTITSTQFNGVDFSGLIGDAEGRLVNHGTVTGNGNAFYGDDGGDTVENHGQMNGHVALLDGDDVYRGHGNAEVSGWIRGDGGNDLIDGSEARERISGGNDTDTLYGNGGNDSMYGGADTDLMYGGWGEDYMRGGTGHDLMEGGSGDDRMMGDSGNDAMFGGAGHDTLQGGSGNDRLEGGTGNDKLTGGSGADVFVFDFASGRDEITDFEKGVDRIDLSALGIDFNDLKSAMFDTGQHMEIDMGKLGGSGVIEIDYLSPGDLTASDFIF